MKILVSMFLRNTTKALCVIVFCASLDCWAKGPKLNEKQTKLLTVASDLLEEAKISYVYGGHKTGGKGECKRCNACLTKKKPVPKTRLKQCPDCVGCSLDCSHFTQLVYRLSGMSYPYLQTRLMAELPPAVLKKNYQLIDIGRDIARAISGDLVVYKGHVVILERLHSREKGGKGDIIHATGGRDVRRPGEGIQRERFVLIDGFRGPIRRILRHTKMYRSGAMRPVNVNQR